MPRTRGQVVWFSGLSGSGKSTICFALENRLREEDLTTHVLDGDVLRQHLCSDLGFKMKDRFENIRRAACVTQILADNGITVLVAMITPLEEMRTIIRSTVQDLIEVYVDAPLETCEARDPKGLYRKARIGAIEHFTGITSPFEIPLHHHVTCNTVTESLEQCVAKVYSAIHRRRCYSVNHLAS